ncbi:MAG: cytochrome c biogenesis protein CcsA [Chloroflexi bacterium]|nr:cytochrome c biogenesis protein CcsA [Chloroflexota bacterium]MBU1746599.1 cytochrome c biogenesis protein CcsA [Chloroflexota bacterium]
MAMLGVLSVLAALALTVGTVAAYVWGLTQRREDLLRLARYGVVAVFAAVVAASIVLMLVLVARDFSVRYVVEHISTDLELGYTMSAFWAGQEGSLLLWELLLAGFAVIVASPWRRTDNQRLADLSAAVLSTVGLFFLLLLTFVTMPFTSSPELVTEGFGLNPQLQNIGMVFHPPSLYVGYVGFAVPFAYALAALILNQADAALFRRMRVWMLFSWLFLGIGIVLGAQWAYVELGWGGYWAWDPVENASLIPWITATAYLHAAVVSDRRGGLRRWSLILLFATFILTIVGTFLTRSGVIASVHAYADGGLLGPLFEGFIALSTIVSLGLLAWRWRHLDAPSGSAGGGLLTREVGFVTATALFAALALAVLVGTLYPIFSQLGGQEQALGITYYEMVSAPLSLLIVALLGVCPALRWRGQPLPDLLRYLAVPAGAAVVAAIASFLVGSREPFVMLSFAACAFAIVSALEATFLDWRRRDQASEDQGALAALWALLVNNRRRYGGYLVHIGVVLLVAGVVGSTVYAYEQTATILKGERVTVGQYTVYFADLDIEVLDNGRAIVRAPMTVTRGGSSAALLPQMVFYPTQENPSSDPAIWGGPGQFFMEDFYVLMADLDPHAGQGTFQMHVNPLMDWLWAGGFIMLLGSMWALWPRRASRSAEPEVQPGQPESKQAQRGKRR